MRLLAKNSTPALGALDLDTLPSVLIVLAPKLESENPPMSET